MKLQPATDDLGRSEDPEGSQALPVVGAAPRHLGQRRAVFRTAEAQMWPIFLLSGFSFVHHMVKSTASVPTLLSVLVVGVMGFGGYVFWRQKTVLNSEGITCLNTLPRARISIRWEDVVALRSEQGGQMAVVGRNGQVIQIHYEMPSKFWRRLAQRLTTVNSEVRDGKWIPQPLPSHSISEEAISSGSPSLQVLILAAFILPLADAIGSVTLTAMTCGAYLLFELLKGNRPERMAKVSFSEEGITICRGRSERRMLWREISLLHCFNPDNVLLLGDHKAELLRGNKVTKAILEAADGRIPRKAVFRSPK